MTPPPLPAVLVASGLALNFWRAQKGDPAKPWISPWACRTNKKVAVAFAAGFSAWWVGHWALYVIDLPDVLDDTPRGG